MKVPNLQERRIQVTDPEEKTLMNLTKQNCHDIAIEQSKVNDLLSYFKRSYGHFNKMSK